MIDISEDLPPIGHIGYMVSNLDESVSRIKDLLGIGGFISYDFVPLRSWVMGKEISDCKRRIAAGVLKTNVKIELVQPISGATPHLEYVSKVGPGLHHIAFYTDRYDEWHEYFESRNADFIFEMEAEDEAIGYRRSFYAVLKGYPGVLEMTEIAKKRNPKMR